MNGFVTALVILASLVFPGAFAAAAAGIDAVLLTAADLPPSCQMIPDSHPVRHEAQVFYDYGIHSDLLPLVLNKRVQSFKCGKEKGALFYFEYTEVAQRERAEVYARTTLWGGDSQPSRDHPENIFHSGRLLMVSSFKDMQKELLTALLKKIKQTEADSASKTPQNPL